MPIEVVLSPYPLQGDSRLLSDNTRTGSTYVQRLQGRECLIKVCFMQIVRDDLDGEF